MNVLNYFRNVSECIEGGFSFSRCYIVPIVVAFYSFGIVNAWACSGSLNAPVTGICSGGTGDVVFQGGTIGYSYQLYKSGNAIGTAFTVNSSIYHLYLGLGSYYVKEAAGNGDHCPGWVSNTVNVSLKSGANLTISTGSQSPYLCTGQSITLTPGGGSGYSWSSSPSGASGTGAITVSPTVQTTYTVSGTEATCGTIVSASITIYVSPAVGQVSKPTGPLSRCQYDANTTSTYVAAPPVNLNYLSYSLSDISPAGGNPGNLNSNTGVLTWNTAFVGTFTVTVNAYSGNNCSTYTTNKSDLITVNPNPSAPSLSPSTVSALYNSSYALPSSSVGGEQYVWYASQSSTTPLSSYTIGPLSGANSYTYYAGRKYTATGCETPVNQRAAFTINVYVDPPPVPVYSTNTCGPITITLPAAPAGVSYYLQTAPNSQSQSTSVSGSYTISNPGTYYLNAKGGSLSLWSTDRAISITSGQEDIVVSSYSPSNPLVQAALSIRLVPGFTVTAGNTFNARIAITSECNDYMNWTEQISYDQSGAIIGRGKTYYDGFGNGLQSQSVDYLNKKVWAAGTLIDRYGVSVGATLPAPILESDFIYKNAFVTNAAGQKYSATEFDKAPPYTNSAGEPTNPNPVGTQPGTVGWYYSSNNNLELKTPVTQYPYSRSFSPEGPDPSKSTSAGPGDNFKMGSTHESKSERYPILASELTHYYNLRTYFPLATSQGNGQGFKYISIDANGNKAASFVDADGRNIATAVATGTNGTYTYDYWSYTYYNDAGQVIGTVAPKDVNTASTAPPVSTKYSYDQLGRLIETTSPDEGTSRFVYSTDGKIRFSENQEQRPGGKFSYTNYDQLGRLVESGEYTSSGGYIFEPHTTSSPAGNSVLTIVDNTINIPIESVTPSPANYAGVSRKLDATRCTDYSFITYDLPGTGSPAAQNYLYGQVSKTENANASTWYSYDEDGLLVWMKQTINGLGTASIDYTYDYFGNVTQVAYQMTTLDSHLDKFYHHYTYDINQRLTEAYTSTDGTNKTLQAKYYYYLHGPLKRVELAGNLQGMDYVYTIDGSLKSINHADIAKDPGADGSSNGFSPDAFGMTLDYFSNDYQGANYNVGTISGNGSANNYNGLIKSASWFTPVDNPSTKKIYGYTYDNLSQLQNAQFGTLSGSQATTGGVYTANLSATNYNESVPAYDKNGNIQSLSRKGKTGSLVDNFSYNYTAATNKLASISGSTTINYAYNTIGQLTQQTEGSVITKVAYNAYGLVKDVKNGSDQLLTTYAYDDHGDLVKRETYNAGTLVKTTFYVHDGAGNVLAIYEQPSGAPTATLMEVPIYGAGRIAVYKPASTTFYELNDHLGNVRAVIGAPVTEIFTATMETEVATAEDAKFKNIAPRQTFTAANNTPGGNEAIRINNGDPNGGYAGRSVGPGIVLHVAPGDVISAEVYGYYEGGTGYSNTLPIATIAANVATAFGGISGATGDPGKLFSSLNTAVNAPGFGGISGSGNDLVPAAYLNMIMLDENMLPDVVNLPNAAIPIPASANMAKQKITIGPINIPTPGYVYIYVNDNSNSNNWVYFDDLKVTQLHSPFVAGADYYPFGLTMNDREIKTEPYRFGYQGQYSEENTQTGWNEFDLRMYDARTGRWISPDPYGQFESPYIGMGNEPVSGTDPDGGWIDPPIKGTPNSLCPTCGGVASSMPHPASFVFSALVGVATNLILDPTKAGVDVAGTFVGGMTSLVTGNPNPKMFSSNGITNFGGADHNQIVKQTAEVGGHQILSAAAGGMLGEGLQTVRILRSMKAGVKVSLATETIVTEETGTLLSLKPTHYITKSENAMKKFVRGVKDDGGILETIKYVEQHGVKHIVDGHHRYYAALKLGYSKVPIQKVQLPFKGYSSAADFAMSGKQPIWWQYFKP